MIDGAVNEDAIERLANHLVTEHQNLLASLVAMRRKHNLSQAQVAERMGVSQPTVASFERYDSNPRLSTVRRYALAVGARLSERVIDNTQAARATSTALRDRQRQFAEQMIEEAAERLDDGPDRIYLTR